MSVVPHNLFVEMVAISDTDSDTDLPECTVPECYKCPITHGEFESPVICTDGVTYEEEAIYAYWGR